MKRLLRCCAWFAIIFALSATLLSNRPAEAETCLSPFVKRLDRPEKYLYVFCVDADAKDNDFLAVIDVDVESPKYGKIIHQLDLGSSGNETHHFGYTDDRTHIWGCSLFSNRIFLINVADDPARAEAGQGLRRLQEDGLDGSALALRAAGPDADQLSRRQGRRPAGGPGGVRNDGTFIRTLPLPKEAPYGYDVAIKPDLNRMVTSSFTPPQNYRKPLAKMDFKKFGNKLLIWDFRARKVLPDADDRSGAAGVPLVAQGRRQPRLHQLRPRRLDLGLGRRRSGRQVHRPQTVRHRQAAGRSAPIARRPLPLCQLLRRQRNSAMGRERSKEAEIDSTVDAGRAAEHDARHRRRQAHVHHQLAVEHAGPLATNFWVRLAHVGPDGLKMDPFFNVDLTKCTVGKKPRKFRGHDMLLN